jgi:hypothetical protein
LNGGIRYDNFGAPVNTGSLRDAVVQLGQGADFPQRISGAAVTYPSNADQRLWAADNRGFAARLGFSWDATKWRGPVVRGGYGVFFDRPFGNLWQEIQNNSVVLPVSFNCTAGSANLCANYLARASTVVAQFQNTPYAADFPQLTLIDPKLRNDYAQSFFVSAQQRISETWSAEISGLGSLGRALVTTDVVNRNFSTPAGQYNASLPEILWRSNQGGSDYMGLTTTVRYRAGRAYAQGSWTWSHSIDNQSDPLAGEFFDLSFVNFTSRAPSQTVAAFARQFDSRADRGSSNFDQRHNVVLLGWYDLPSAHERHFIALTRGWRLASVSAFRTGFPFSVLAPSTGAIINQRADLVAPGAVSAVSEIPAKTGSVVLLNPAAFAEPATGVLGNTGRNSFSGPGLWSADISVSRTLTLPHTDSMRLILRSDFYNALNHANLNNPISLLGSPGFGQASRGRLGYDTGFPALVPLNETARQVQMLIKLEF